MQQKTARDLVIVMTRGTDHELSSVAFTIANGGLTAGLKVYAFLTSASVDLVRKRAIDLTHVPPLDPLGALVADFLKRGGVIWACPPCVTARGYTQDDFIEGVTIQGASAMHALIQNGAATTFSGLDSQQTPPETRPAAFRSADARRHRGGRSRGAVATDRATAAVDNDARRLWRPAAKAT